jgi:hypothetical protein
LVWRGPDEPYSLEEITYACRLNLQRRFPADPPPAVASTREPIAEYERYDLIFIDSAGEPAFVSPPAEMERDTLSAVDCAVLRVMCGEVLRRLDAVEGAAEAGQ